MPSSTCLIRTVALLWVLLVVGCGDGAAVDVNSQTRVGTRGSDGKVLSVETGDENLRHRVSPDDRRASQRAALPSQSFDDGSAQTESDSGVDQGAYAQHHASYSPEKQRQVDAVMAKMIARDLAVPKGVDDGKFKVVFDLPRGLGSDDDSVPTPPHDSHPDGFVPPVPQNSSFEDLWKVMKREEREDSLVSDQYNLSDVITGFLELEAEHEAQVEREQRAEALPLRGGRIGATKVLSPPKLDGVDGTNSFDAAVDSVAAMHRLEHPEHVLRSVMTGFGGGSHSYGHGEGTLTSQQFDNDALRKEWQKLDERRERAKLESDARRRFVTRDEGGRRAGGGGLGSRPLPDFDGGQKNEHVDPQQDLWAKWRASAAPEEEAKRRAFSKTGLTQSPDPDGQRGWYHLDGKPQTNKKFSCAGERCGDLLTPSHESFLQTGSHSRMRTTEAFRQDCMCAPAPALECKQVCDCKIKEPTTDGVIYGQQAVYGHGQTGLGNMQEVNAAVAASSYLEIEAAAGEAVAKGKKATADDGVAGGQASAHNDPEADDDQAGITSGSPVNDYAAMDEDDEFPEEPCLGKGRWCENTEQCCGEMECGEHFYCYYPQGAPTPIPLKRRPDEVDPRDETYLGAGDNLTDAKFQYRNWTKRKPGAPPPGSWRSKPVFKGDIPMDCECTMHDCTFNGTCRCGRRDEWEDTTCKLMGMRGRAVRLNGRGQYMWFRRSPVRCHSFTLEMWVNVKRQRPWARLFDIGWHRWRWLMISPKGWGWWGTIAAWRYYWWWGWVHTQAVPTDEWCHVTLIFGYWHVCILLNGEYRHCHWNHWRVRNAWRYYGWRNFIGRSQYWWDPTLRADVDEVRIWCGWRGGYWIRKYMYQIITERPWWLLGYWKLNEQKGIIARDEKGWNDIFTWDYTWKRDYRRINARQWPKFVVSDAPIFHRVYNCPKDIPKGPGYALHFHGWRWRAAYILARREVFNKLQAHTVEGWVRIPGWLHDHWMRWIDIGAGDWWPRRNLLWSLGLPGRRASVFAARHPRHSWHYDWIAAPPFPRNRWMHVAYVHTGSNVQLYLDGRPTGPNKRIRTKPSEICGHYNFFGRSAYPWDNYFFGEMDEIRVWNYARSQSQINIQRRLRLEGSESGLVAYWGMDEGGGRQIFDSTANHYDAAIVGHVGFIRSTAPLKIMLA